MRWALVVLVCGCNPIFGIDDTHLVDAPPPIDAPPPPSCPAVGTLPRFGTELNMIAARTCSEYQVDATGTFAIAVCTDNTTGASVLAGGPVDQPLAALTVTTPPDYYYGARLAPEGDAIFVTGYSYTTYTTSTSEYRLIDGVWTLGNPLTLDPTVYFSYTMSQPTRGPVRRMVTTLYDQTTYVYYLAELEWDGTTAKAVNRTELTELGVDSVTYPSLSADGLRLVFSAGSNIVQGGGSGAGIGEGSGIGTGIGTYDQPVYYSDRESTADKFHKAVVIDSVPSLVTWPFLTENCGRIYFSALNTVWYLSKSTQ